MSVTVVLSPPPINGVSFSVVLNAAASHAASMTVTVNGDERTFTLTEQGGVAADPDAILVGSGDTFRMTVTLTDGEMTSGQRLEVTLAEGGDELSSDSATVI